MLPRLSTWPLQQIPFPVLHHANILEDKGPFVYVVCVRESDLLNSHSLKAFGSVYENALTCHLGIYVYIADKISGSVCVCVCSQ